MNKEKLNIYCQLAAFIVGSAIALYFFEQRAVDFDTIGIVFVEVLLYTWWLYENYKKRLPKSVVNYCTNLNYGKASCLSVLFLSFVYFSFATLVGNLILCLDDWQKTTVLILLGIGAIYLTFVAKSRD